MAEMSTEFDVDKAIEDMVDDVIVVLSDEIKQMLKNKRMNG